MNVCLNMGLHVSECVCMHRDIKNNFHLFSVRNSPVEGDENLQNIPVIESSTIVELYADSCIYIRTYL